MSDFSYHQDPNSSSSPPNFDLLQTASSPSSSSISATSRITSRFFQAQENQKRIEKELHEKNLIIVDLKSDLETTRDLLARREAEIKNLHESSSAISASSWNPSTNHDNNASLSQQEVRTKMRDEAIKMQWFREMALLELQEQIARNTVIDVARDESFDVFAEAFVEIGKQQGDEDASERSKHRINTLMFQLRVSQSMHVKKLRKQIAEMSIKLKEVTTSSAKNGKSVSSSSNSNTTTSEKEEIEKQKQLIASLQKEVDDHEKKQQQNEQELFQLSSSNAKEQDIMEYEVQRRVEELTSEFDVTITKSKKANQKLKDQIKQLETQIQEQQQSSQLSSEESKKWETEAKKLRTQNRILSHQNKEHLQQIQDLQTTPGNNKSRKASSSTLSNSNTTTATGGRTKTPVSPRVASSSTRSSSLNSSLTRINSVGGNGVLNQQQQQQRSTSSGSSSTPTSPLNDNTSQQQIIAIQKEQQREEEFEKLLQESRDEIEKWKQEAEKLQLQVKEYESVIETIHQEDEDRQQERSLTEEKLEMAEKKVEELSGLLVAAEQQRQEEIQNESTNNSLQKQPSLSQSQSQQQETKLHLTTSTAEASDGTSMTVGTDGAGRDYYEIHETDESTHSYQQQQQLSQLQFLVDDLQSQLAASQMKLQESERRLSVLQQQQRSPSSNSVVSTLFPSQQNINNNSNNSPSQHLHPHFHNQNQNHANSSNHHQLDALVGGLTQSPGATPTKQQQQYQKQNDENSPSLPISPSGAQQQNHQGQENNNNNSVKRQLSVLDDTLLIATRNEAEYELFIEENKSFLYHLEDLFEDQTTHFNLVNVLFLQSCDLIFEEQLNSIEQIRQSQEEREKELTASLLLLHQQQQVHHKSPSPSPSPASSSTATTVLANNNNNLTNQAIITELERTISTLKNELEEEESAKLRAKRRHGEEVEDLERRLDGAKIRYNSLEDEIKTVQEKLSLANTEASAAQERNRELERKLASERDHNSNSKDKIGSLESELETARRASLETRKELDETRARHATELIAREGEFDRSRKKLLEQINATQEELAALKLQQHSQQMDHMSELHKVERHALDRIAAAEGEAASSNRQMFEELQDRKERVAVLEKKLLSSQEQQHEKEEQEQEENQNFVENAKKNQHEQRQKVVFQFLLENLQENQNLFFSSSLSLFDSYSMAKMNLLLISFHNKMKEIASSSSSKPISNTNNNTQEEKDESQQQKLEALRQELESKHHRQLQKQIIKYEAEKEELARRIAELQQQRDIDFANQQQQALMGFLGGNTTGGGGEVGTVTSPETLELICELRNKLADAERALRIERNNKKL